MRCTFCGSKSHTLLYCPHTWGGAARRTNLNCSFCGSNRHTIKGCPKTFIGSINRQRFKDFIKD